MCLMNEDVRNELNPVIFNCHFPPPEWTDLSNQYLMYIYNVVSSMYYLALCSLIWRQQWW